MGRASTAATKLAVVPTEGDSTWDKILRTSAELFARNGYHATGIAELSSTLGISRGSLYHYIDGKQSLLFEICRTQVGRLNSVAAEIAARDTPAGDRLRDLARSLLANISDHRAEWTVFFTDFGALTGPAREEIIEARTRYEESWRSVIKDGTASGEFRAVPEIVVKGILGMFNYTYLWLRSDGPLSVDEIADEFLAVVLRGIADPAPGSTRSARARSGTAGRRANR